ncbi:MAG TPA: choice-of-anchor Q domain-containing protein [Polyangiaceae bacterium]
MTIADGKLTSADREVPALGGGVRANGDVELERVTFRDNSATGADDPDTSNSNIAHAGPAYGGALHVAGKLTATDSRFIANVARGGRRSGNGLGGAAEGGGGYVLGAVMITRGSFETNMARGGSSGGAARGGALAQADTSTATVTLTGTALSGNRAEAASASTSATRFITAGGTATGGAVASGGAATATNITAQDNVATGGANDLGSFGSGHAYGGAIAALAGATIATSAFARNEALGGSGYIVCRATGTCQSAPPGGAQGGAVFAARALQADGGSFSSNEATSGSYWSPGGVFGTPPPLPSFHPRTRGGALNSELELVVQGGEYSGNSAGGPALGSGGGVSVSDAKLSAGDGILAAGHADVVRTALATGELEAASLRADSSTASIVRSAGQAELVNTTVTTMALVDSLLLDHATLAEVFVQAAHITSHRSVVSPRSSQPICSGTDVVSASSYNVFGDTSCGLHGVGDRQSADVLFVAPLADNGGPVPTRLPLPTSVLLDRIPGSACPIRVDARGLPRPTGAGCDVGAVEAQPISGVGATNLSVVFVNPPASVGPGQSATWQLRVNNRGSSGAVFALLVDVPDGVSVTSVTSTRPAACSHVPQVSCFWTSPLPAGAETVITINAGVAPTTTTPLVWRATLTGTQLLPPTSDDMAQLTTPVTPNASLSASFEDRVDSVGFEQPRGWAQLRVHNAGPTAAIGTDAAPIRVQFLPGPGVIATTGDPQANFVGSVPANNTVDVTAFGFSVEGTIPTELGRVAWDPGLNTAVGPRSFPVYAADLEVSVARAATPLPETTPVPFSMRVTNHGPGPAERVSVRVYQSGEGATLTFSPDRGLVVPEPESQVFVWSLDSLAVGESATLQGTTLGIWMTYEATSDGVDFNGSNNRGNLDLRPAPNGAADLLVENVQILPGANAQERRVRATVRNAGPAAITVNEFNELRIDFVTVHLADARAESSSTTAPGWTCSFSRCYSTEPLPAGATVPVEFVVTTFQDFTQGRAPLGVSVRSDSPLPVPDPNPHNNTLYGGTAGNPL